MSVQPETQTPFPFQVEPVSQKQVQGWANFAGYTLTRRGFHVVIEAFNVFWFMDAAYEDYTCALSCIQDGNILRAVGWLDPIVRSVGWQAQGWQNVVQNVQAIRVEHPGMFDEWYQDAQAHMQNALLLQQAIVTYVFDVCSFYAWDIPEHTKAFLAEQQLQQSVSMKN